MNKKFLTALFVSAAVLFNLAMVATTSFSGDINLAKLSQAFAGEGPEAPYDDGTSAYGNDEDDEASDPQGFNEWDEYPVNCGEYTNVTITHCDPQEGGQQTCDEVDPCIGV